MPRNRKSGVYAIRNLVNGKVYIGSSQNIDARWNNHKFELRNGVHGNEKLQRAWSKYLEASFVFEILELAEVDDLLACEQRLIDFYCAVRNGYNIRPTAGSARGMKQSTETIEKRRAKLVGRKRPQYAIDATAAARRGTKWTEEQRAKYIASKTGVKMPPFSEVHRARLSAAATGRRLSDAHKDAVRQSNLRRGAPALTVEQRAAGDAKRRGAKRTPEQIENMRIGRLLAQQRRQIVQAEQQ